MFEKKDRKPEIFDAPSPEAAKAREEYLKRLEEAALSPFPPMPESGKGPIVDGSAYKGGEYA